MKKTLTKEQEEQRDARRAKFRGFAAQIAKLSAVEQAELAAKMGGVVTVEGRSLSMHNTCMIALQNPSATVVGGFRQWIKAGRCVRKGEHGLMIWVPCGVKDEASDGSTIEPEERHFIIGTLFDVSQTDATETTADVVEAVSNPTADRLCQGRTIWNSDGRNGPCLICAPPAK